MNWPRKRQFTILTNARKRLVYYRMLAFRFCGRIKIKAMAQFERLEIGKVSLVQETEDGRIRQIGLTQEQSDLLQYYVAILSKQSPLVQMGEEYDLRLKRDNEK